MENLEDLIKIEWSNQRVLTTAQLAYVYKCSPKHIKDNFRIAKTYFQKGVHYIKLESEDLRTFKGLAEQIGLAVSPFASRLYLWTYPGCARHCKTERSHFYGKHSNHLTY